MNDLINNKIILYRAEDGKTEIEVNLDGETVWLSQRQMAELFDCTSENIIIHLKNVFASGELNEKSTTKDSLVVQKEGNRSIKRPVRLYNLDMIISVGYKINSLRGTQFRIWATQKLRDYIVKGFVMDDERLAEGGVKKRFFEEWLERVRKIRTSEKNLYEKVKDIFATSIDYSSNTDITKEFYATMQNKFHYAITGSTAAELVANRVSSKKGDLVIADASEDYADIGKCIEIINLNGEKVLSGLHTFLARPDLYKMESSFGSYLMKSQQARLKINKPF